MADTHQSTKPPAHPQHHSLSTTATPQEGGVGLGTSGWCCIIAAPRVVLVSSAFESQGLEAQAHTLLMEPLPSGVTPLTPKPGGELLLPSWIRGLMSCVSKPLVRIQQWAPHSTSGSSPKKQQQ